MNFIDGWIIKGTASASGQKWTRVGGEFLLGQMKGSCGRVTHLDIVDESPTLCTLLA
jgi:hypothetical protein